MTAKLQLVVVEDSVIDAELVARHLSKAGLDVVMHRVQTESELVSALREKQPDLILSDCSLPAVQKLDCGHLVSSPSLPPRKYPLSTFPERSARSAPLTRCGEARPTNIAEDQFHAAACLPCAVERGRCARKRMEKADQRKSEQQRREQEVRLQRLTRSYRMLSSTSSAILRLHDRADLLDEVCRIAVELGGYEQRGLISPPTSIRGRQDTPAPRLRRKGYGASARRRHRGAGVRSAARDGRTGDSHRYAERPQRPRGRAAIGRSAAIRRTARCFAMAWASGRLPRCRCSSTAPPSASSPCTAPRAGFSMRPKWAFCRSGPPIWVLRFNISTRMKLFPCSVVFRQPHRARQGVTFMSQRLALTFD